jgi:hypothetical protein
MRHEIDNARNGRGDAPTQVFSKRESQGRHPRKSRGGPDYYCPFQILGLDDDRVRRAWGIDPVQALQLAMRQIGALLSASDAAKTGRLSWDAGSTKGDFGFPVP